MKKIFVAASGLLILLGVTLRAEANFFISSQPSKPCPSQRITKSPCPERITQQTTCPLPSSSQAWQAPTLTKIPCATPIARPCPVPCQPTATAPACNTTCIYKKPTCILPQRQDRIMVVMYEGSLKNNVERIMHQHGWSTVLWKLSVDYRWVGTAKVCGPTLEEVVDTVLSPFPLEITFYHANRVVTITQRKYHE